MGEALRNQADHGDAKSRLDHLLSELRQESDELVVKMHLAKSDLKDEWSALEKKWHQLNRKAAAAADAARDAGENIDSAWHLLLDEIKHGYRQIRDKL